MTTMQLLTDLRAAKVRLWAENGALRHEAPIGLDDRLSARLSAHEDEILAYLVGSDDCEMSTRYVPMRDGVRLAVDLFRPKRDGTLVTEPLPTIWCHDRYQRSSIHDSVIWTKFDSRPWLRAVMRHGYVVAVVDARGTGASTGARTTELASVEAKDAYEITEWLAGEEWCTGRIGMFGDSYLAIAQLLAASVAPPHLRAVMPQMPLFDLYDFLRPGGVFRHDFARRWSARVQQFDVDGAVAPVAGRADVAGSAAAEHERNADAFARIATHPYRDSRDPTTGEPVYGVGNPMTLREQVAASGVAVHQLSGWYDVWVRDALLWHANLPNPRRLTIDASSHTGRVDIDLVHEHLSWFDHWLKDVDNGVTDQPPIRYRIMNGRDGAVWATTTDWPPPGHALQPLHFAAGPTGTVDSVNDGALTLVAGGAGDEAADDYVVDYRASSGRGSRWANGYGADFGYPPMTGNDRLGLTYTSPVLRHDVEVTGHPVAYLFVTSSDPDGDFFVYLEEVDEEGTSHYVTEGVLRASYRRLERPPYRNFGLPYHPAREQDHEELPLIPTELLIDLHPTSYLFRAGHRIRITVTGCDHDNAETPVMSTPPTVQVHRGPSLPSRVDLPVVGAGVVLDA